MAKLFGALAGRSRRPAAEHRSVRWLSDSVESEGFLFVVAELAVAFAAFAGLVTIVSQRLSNREAGSHSEAQQLRSLLLSSLLTAFAALVPYLPHHAGLPPEVAWRLSSGIFAAAWSTHLVYAILNVRATLSRLDIPNPWSVVPRMYWPNHAIQALLIVSLCLGAMGVWSGGVGTVYLGALLTCLYVCASLLVSLFMSLARSHAT